MHGTKTGLFTLRRGYEFGESCVVCGAHWQRDVEAVRRMDGAAPPPRFMLALGKVKREFVAENAALCELRQISETREFAQGQ